MERYMCIHGHFYQPPRENPWLESIEVQDSAYPYHDWNERITAECYASNALSRILDKQDRITLITNNYARISFNFGPTLLSWLEMNHPEIYKAILDADSESQKSFSGHGSALAQAYNHMIMPLANRRDKYTQVIWGIRDFQHRFGRDPEGMWLPETAVDIETLEVLAELGIRFTILAPQQAKRTRSIGDNDWEDVSDGNIDPTTAYLIHLPSGRTIAVYFYHELIARAVAFEGLLSNGESFARRLNSAFSEDRNWPQLVHIATDGETYGHHHHHGDMALAYVLDYIESNNLARITNYGEYLDKNPPTHEVEIIENTSWSCAHGIERWRSDCGCNSGGHPKWNQIWRTPLRESMDWLRDTLTPLYEQRGKELLNDPWAARNDYIDVVLDRSPNNVNLFLEKHSNKKLDDNQRINTLKLLEVQRHAMLMYTSCGWFFDEISGIETVQVIQYAGRVIQLAQELFGNTIKSRFLELLEQAQSNIRKHGNGRLIYEKFVEPSMVDLIYVTAHYAISSLFEEYEEATKIYCYLLELKDYETKVAGKAKLAIGRAHVTSQITFESETLTFAVVHFGDQNMNAGVGTYRKKAAYKNMVRDITNTFPKCDFAEVIREMDKYFGTSFYSLRYLFRDEQRKVLNGVLESTLSEVEALYRQVYDHHGPLMQFMIDLGNPLPKPYQTAAELIINVDLRREFTIDSLNSERITQLIEEASAWNVELDTEGLGFTLQQTIEEIMERYTDTPNDIMQLQELIAAIELATSLPFEVNLWKVQNIYYTMLKTIYPTFQKMAERGDKPTEEWITLFNTLGDRLSILVA